MVVASGEVRLPRFLRREAGAEIDRLYRRHSEDVLRYTLLVLRSRSDAEDVTQTVFLRALRAIERGEQVRAPRNWLIKIAHNECRRLMANRKLHLELPDEIAVEPVERGQADELRRAMGALPAHQRQALVLRELEGRSYGEIAASLDLSVSAVETLIFRARRALREQLDGAMSCDEFVELLDDPSARSRVRAHARVCPGCATLDHQYRGRKSALKRIASAFGLPWWGAKLAGVALTTGAVAVALVPHDAARPSEPANQLNPIPRTAQSPYHLNLVPPSPRPKVVAPGSETRFKSVSPTSASAPAATSPAVVPPAVLPGPEEPAPTTPEPETPQPPPLPSPTKIVPVAPPVTDPEPVLTVPETVLPPLPEAPTVALPPLEPPTATVPLETPKVSLP
ncbi:MAG: sigma-70 family RNA polymerase sigma factor [Gaiellaceae bacterium]